MLDDVARRLIAASPMVLVASHDGDGRCDVSPRGGPAGFVADARRGSTSRSPTRRATTASTRCATSSPRARGPASSWSPAATRRCASTARPASPPTPRSSTRSRPVGKPPRTAIVVRAEEVYAHCPKAFVRSRLWDPATWTPAGELPSRPRSCSPTSATRTRTLAEEEAYLAESLRTRLA